MENLKSDHEKIYKLGKLVEKTLTSLVYEAKNEEKKVIIKLVTKATYEHESKILRRIQEINSPYLIRLLDTLNLSSPIEGKTHGLIFEKYPSCLLDYIVDYSDRKNYDQVILEGKRLFKQISSGLQCLHSNNIVHLDLKLENILMTDNHDIVIIDFNLSEIVSSSTPITKICGSYDYLCPEIVQMKPYDPFKADIWALGVILYSLVTDSLPFTNPNRHVIFSNILSLEIIFPYETELVTQDLLSHLLDRNAATRFSIEQVLQHPYLHQ